LKHLLAIGLISRRDDPSHSQKAIYSLTEPSIALLPVLAVMGGWGRKHLPVTPELSIRAELLEDGGPRMWEEFMNELRDIHISNPIE
ncbi:winged helix-turn-helix transcriptional regulator, partial [Rhizobium ruizarguesonis]